MKSSATSQGTQSDESENDDGESTPTGMSTQPPADEQHTQAPRPQMMRSPPGRLSDITQNLAESQPAEGEEQSGSDDAEDGLHARVGEDGSAERRSPASISEGEKIAKMRDAMNAKLLLQQRMRRSQGHLHPESGSKRVSPIQEEEAVSTSPSLDATLARHPSATRSNSALSTESTESSKTVRGGKPGTPSYPFPYVPGNPRTWSSGFHQPFTTLSPTVSGTPAMEGDTPRKPSSMFSETSTPGQNPSAFMPPGTAFQVPEDPRFPSPNLYDLVLQLNAEPGLEQWWATVTNLMHDHFKADRVTLVMPMDPTDIENVPWGQKATFSMNGPEEFVPHRTVVEQTSHATAYSRPELVFRGPSTDASDVKPQKLHPERLRPRLEARHSYAGHGRENFNEGPSKPSVRPAGPQRGMTHAADSAADAGPARISTHRFPSASTQRHGSASDLEFSSIGADVDAGPYAEVFTTIRSLGHEVRPLIESGGVNRVLDRGRVVTVTRDYVPDSSDTSDEKKRPNTALANADAPEAAPSTASKPASESIFGNYRSVFAADNGFSTAKDYEEYEQYPTSPWSQSPAPSPAIRADEEENPFFASEEQQVEQSFNPANTPKDYSQLGQVEAIGVDNASTVVHIPLVHPTLSQPMQSLKTYAKASDESEAPRRSNTLDMERKAPIAILSILSSAVPYPHNLVQSLKLLGPHLATSFATSQQFSSTHLQAVTIRNRRTMSGHTYQDAPMTLEPTSLADIVNAEVEEPPGSVSGSVTSPSEYSSRSKHSPSGSIVGTPGWDPASHGWPASKSATGTPNVTGTEIVDNYFEAKKRAGQRSATNTQGQNTPVRSGRKGPNLESRGDEDLKASHDDRKLKTSTLAKDERSPLRPGHEKDAGASSFAEAASPHRPFLRKSMSHNPESVAEKRHSQLHSYGADFHTSFGVLPSPSLESRMPGGFGHGRKPSYSEDMPPPSERLLRTIIDSVPVQIFTAEPETGKLTWVNSKFLIYRGQEPRQILDEPWQAIHPDDREDFMATWHRSLRTTQQLQQKVRLERFDGSYRWFYVRAAPLKDKRQKIVHWIGTMMDFHEQHIAETNSARQQETAASEAKYRALANSSPQIVFAVNRAKGVTFCNTQWMHFSGQPEAQALGVGFMDHVHPEDLVKCRLPTFDQNSDSPRNVPTSLPPELKRKPSESTASNCSSETEKGIANVETSPLTGHMPQRKLSELASTGILKVARDADGRPSYSTEVRLKSKDGEFRWHLVRVLLAEPLLQSGSEEETWYGTCTDINDHKTLERDLKETMDEKSRFLSNMSHEIRTPLNGITGMVNFLIDSNLTAEQLEHANVIRSSAEGLRGLINDILDLSKAEAGMIQLNMDWFFVRSLIEEVNDLTSAMGIDKGLELNYLVEEDVPAQIKGDRFRIRQVLLNIVGNAIKFTQKGEVFVRCSTHQSAVDELAKNELFIKFDVVDSGRGFTEKEAEHLFKRFSQIDGSSTRQHGGSGLGLVISRQLTQLHGGDMSAKGIPDKGSTFTFFVKTTLPSKRDQPPSLSTAGVVSIPILPMSPGATPSPTSVPKMKLPSFPMPSDAPARASPKFSLEHTQSPSPYATSPEIGKESPSVSSASSDPSAPSATRTNSLRSERSSASSFMPDPSGPMKLALPNDPMSRSGGSDSFSNNSIETPKAANLSQSGAALVPPMYSILVLCPLKYAREATVHHIDKTLPNSIPHQITARESLLEFQQMTAGNDPVHFTHVVVVLQDVDDIVALISQILTATPNQTPEIVIITDLAQRKKIMEQAPNYDYQELANQRRLRFVFKPLKPSRVAIIFDPRKEREMSTDRNHDSAQQVALTQKQVFDELTGRLGNKGKRVLLVEDNRTNQMVVQKFLKKVSINSETALDGVECTEKVFSHPPGFYSIILCDLHMPNKDGYQTCKDVRKWERQQKLQHLPIIALSANVLGDVYQKCVESGFNSYMTKPVDFKELSTALITFLDPSDPNKPHEFMKNKRRQSLAHGR